MSNLIKKTLVGGCVIFTCSMTIWTIFGLIFAGPEYGLLVTITLLIGCVCLAILQSFWFTNRILKRLAYPGRVLGFGLTAFVVLALCAYLGQWLPTDDLGAWGTFTLIYLAILALMTAAYTLFYRRSSRNLDEALSRYRAEHRQ